MSAPLCTDPASAVIDSVIAAMKTVFSPTSDCPPVGGGSTTVQFFAGEGAPIDEVNCDSPMLWVRLAGRYRSEIFPDPSMTLSPCAATEVITVEIGVARCASVEVQLTAAQYAQEAETSLDDSWRIGKVMCLVSGTLSNDHQVGTDVVSPYGPEGGVVVWTSNLYISI